MKTKALLPFMLVLIIQISAFAQTQHYSKLVIKEKDVFEVGPGNVLSVDTLIMHDKATIKFSPDTIGILKATYATIGEKCFIIAKGANGINSDSKALGTFGQDGGNLDISLYFHKLGSLTIDTRGGRGGNGGRIISTDGEIFIVKDTKLSDGRTAKEVVPTPTGFNIPQTGYNGIDATVGLYGGNGGSINLTYNTDNFIPLFNKSKGRHRITLLHTAGEHGKDGVPSRDGKLVTLANEEPANGTIKLINTNATGFKE